MSIAREFPAAEPRVETGPVQFGNDWPGVFIRGDCAFGYAMCLEQVLQAMGDGEVPHVLFWKQLDGLLHVLRSSTELAPASGAG